MSIGFFRKTFNIQPDVFMLWYYAGILTTLIVSNKLNGEPLSKFVEPSVWGLLGIFVIGLTIGAGANINTFRAYAIAPNAGIVQALQEVAVPLMFFLTIALSKVLPDYFKTEGSVNVLWSTGGLLMTIGGVLIIILKGTAK
jgi:hypothetical protein